MPLSTIINSNYSALLPYNNSYQFKFDDASENQYVFQLDSF